MKAGVRSAIGLKNRFVFLIATLFLGSNIFLGAIQFYLFQREQWNLIDTRIETTATLLLKSDLSKDDLDDVEFSRSLIEGSIDSQPFNLFIRIFSDSFQLLYKTGESLSTPYPSKGSQHWNTYRDPSGSLIRTLSLPLPKQKSDRQRYLEVGVIVDNELIGTTHIKNIVTILILLFVIAAFLVTQILVRYFLNPLKLMSETIRDLSQAIGEKSFDVTMRGISLPKELHSEEFEILLHDIETLSTSIRYRLRDIRFWTSQMAHELRTPLTIISNRMEQISPDLDLRHKQKLKDINDELEYLKSLLTAFMTWVEASQTLTITSELNVIPLNKFVSDLIPLYESRESLGQIQLWEDSKISIFCNKFFLKQLLTNLIDNAIKYSVNSREPISLKIKGSLLTIENIGPCITPEVQDRIGLPFNYSKVNKKGFGLGLAWVKMICDNYKIKFTIESIKVDDCSCKILVFLDFSALLVNPELR